MIDVKVKFLLFSVCTMSFLDIQNSVADIANTKENSSAKDKTLESAENVKVIQQQSKIIKNKEKEEDNVKKYENQINRRKKTVSKLSTKQDFDDSKIENIEENAIKNSTILKNKFNLKGNINDKNIFAIEVNNKKSALRFKSSSKKAKTLSLSDVLIKCLSNNLEAFAAKHNKNVSLYELSVAVHSFLPNIQINLRKNLSRFKQRYLTAGGNSVVNDNNGIECGISIKQNLFSFWSDSNKIKAAESNIKAKYHAYIAELQIVLAKTAKAYYSLLFLLKKSKIYKLMILQAKALLENVIQQAKAGYKTEVEIQEAKANVAKFESELAALTYQIAQSQSEFINLIGEEVEEICDEEIEDAWLEKVNISDLIVKIKNNPSFLSARAEATQLQYETQSACGAIMPTLNLEAGASTTDGISRQTQWNGRDNVPFEPNAINNTLNFNAAVVLNINLLNQAQISSTKVRESQYMATASKALAKYRALVGNIYATLNKVIATKMLLNSARENVYHCKLAAEGSKSAHDNGLKPTFEVIRNQIASMEACTKYLDAQSNYAELLIDLKVLIGEMNVAINDKKLHKKLKEETNIGIEKGYLSGITGYGG